MEESADLVGISEVPEIPGSVKAFHAPLPLELAFFSLAQLISADSSGVSIQLCGFAGRFAWLH
jgi:hypothetical protein